MARCLICQCDVGQMKAMSHHHIPDTTSYTSGMPQRLGGSCGMANADTLVFNYSFTIFVQWCLQIAVVTTQLQRFLHTTSKLLSLKNELHSLEDFLGFGFTKVYMLLKW